MEREKELQAVEVNEMANQAIEIPAGDVIDAIIDRTVSVAVNAAVERMSELVEEMRAAAASVSSMPSVALGGAVSGEMGREAPDKRVDFSKLSYSELCAFLDNNPKAKL